jgi:hypothetical protein
VVAFAVRDKFEVDLHLKLINDVANRVDKISLNFLNLLGINIISMHKDGQHCWFARERVETRVLVLEAIHLFDLSDVILPPL